MILFHGSNTDIAQIELSKCRPNKDFGKGFYLTTIREQAVRMAQRVARMYGGSPTLNIYDFDNFKKLTDQYSFHSEKAIALLKKKESAHV